jgi:3-hydroxyisobutyrate dehydrogenase
LAGLAGDRDIQVLEAPVTGGVHKAAAGEITVLVGGDPAVFEQHRDLLGAMGDPVLYMGPLGSAALIKVITNMLAFINLVAAGEALMLAKRGGLDLAASFEAIANSSGTSFVHETESQLILNGSYNIGFTMDLACKDLGFATQFGRQLGVPLELAGLVEQTFVRARAVYGGGAWSSQVVKLLEDALGVDLRAPGFPATLQ